MALKAFSRALLFSFIGLLLSVNPIEGQSRSNWSVLHTFAYWGTLQTPLEKMIFLNGWTNGYFQGPRSSNFLAFADCMEGKLTEEQAAAMIDKFYNDHPERWSVPLGYGIVLALTVKDSPCSKTLPK